MTADELLAMYYDMCQAQVVIRRYSGTGNARAKNDFAAAGSAPRLYSGKELVGAIQQGDQAVIVIAADLVTSGMTLPVTDFDKVVFEGRERSIISVSERRALDATLIAYELQARG